MYCRFQTIGQDHIVAAGPVAALNDMSSSTFASSLHPAYSDASRTVKSSAGPRKSWLCATANAFQSLLGRLSDATSAEELRATLDHLSEPVTEVERLIFRSFVSELLLDGCYLGGAMVRREILESALNAWPLIRRDPRPVAVLRRSLACERHLLRPPELQLAEQVHDLLDQCYSERILARDVAKTLGVSESRLNRCFRLAFGSTIHRYLLKLRVRHGLDLIAQGMKIEAAALSVGFRSKKDFYHAVQQLVGCTPAQFRSRRIRP